MTAPIPGRRYRAGDVEGKWAAYNQPARYAGRLVLDDGSSVSIAPGLEQHLVPVETPERRVVLTCGRSRVYGVLQEEQSHYWYTVRIDGDPHDLRSFRKAVWTLADESQAAYQARRPWAYRLDLWLHDHVEWLWWRLPVRWSRWWA